MRGWLYDIRRAAGKSQEEVAELAGIAQTTYSGIETGARNPSVSMAKKISGALGFDWTDFYNDESA